MNKNSRHIDKLRFRLFEIGIQITEQQAEFEIAKAKQALLKMKNQNKFRVAPYTSALLKTSITHESTSDDHVIKHALSMSYKAYLPYKKQKSKTLFQIELEQLATPSPEQIRHYANTYPFELREYLQFSNQFQPKVNLLWSGVHKNLLNTQNSDYTEVLWQFFPQQMMQWRSNLQGITGIDIKAYMPLILHPWQFKHCIIKEFKETLHEKLIIGPLIKQSAYPLFDPSYLIMENYSNPHLKISLFDQPLSMDSSLKRKLNKRLQEENYFNQRLFCLEKTPLLNLKNGCNCLSSQLIHTPHAFLDKAETVIPLVSLVNSSYLLDKPLLLTIVDDKPACFLGLFTTLLNVYLKTHIQLLKHHHLFINSDIEHLLIAFKENKVTKIVHRSPNIIKAHKCNVTLMNKLQEPLKQILKCYLHHSGDKQTYRACMLNLKVALETHSH